MLRKVLDVHRLQFFPAADSRSIPRVLIGDIVITQENQVVPGMTRASNLLQLFGRLAVIVHAKDQRRDYRDLCIACP